MGFVESGAALQVAPTAEVNMPIPASKRNYKHEATLEKKRSGAHEARMERQRARRALDKKGVNRAGKDVAHVKALAKGGSNSDGYYLESPKKNRSYARDSNHKPKNTYAKPKK
jgi:hypothetical protein